MGAPTCSTCGSALFGYERSKKLNTPIYFFPNCRSAEEEAARLKGKEAVAATRELQEAA